MLPKSWESADCRDKFPRSERVSVAFFSSLYFSSAIALLCGLFSWEWGSDIYTYVWVCRGSISQVSGAFAAHSRSAPMAPHSDSQLPFHF